MKHSKGKSVVTEVIKRIDARKGPIRTKRTLVLTRDTYDEFERLCRAAGRWPSQVIDEFVNLFVEQDGK